MINSQDVQKGKNKITWSFALDWHTANLEFRSFSVFDKFEEVLSRLEKSQKVLSFRVDLFG